MSSFSLARTFRFFVCTRNRPEELAQCLSSLARTFLFAFPGQQALCYIFDDSTTQEMSSRVFELCIQKHFEGLHVHYIHTAEDIALLQSPSRLTSQSFRKLRSFCKQLGHPAWDLAGVRNLAFVCALSYAQEDDFLLFLDDDMLFESSNYQGHFLVIDGISVLRQLAQQTPPRMIVASGVGYYGRHDTSLRQHMQLVLEEIQQLLSIHKMGTNMSPLLQKRLHELSHFPHAIPLRLNLPGFALAEGGPGISGAILATTVASLRSHCLPRWYNEDWIWLSLLGAGPGTLRKIEASVIHAAPPQLPITLDFFQYQMYGDILYLALEVALKDIPPQTHRLAYCQHHLSSRHFVIAQQESLKMLWNDWKQVQEIRRFLLQQGKSANSVDLLPLLHSLHHVAQYLHETIRFVEAQTPSLLWNEFHHYLDAIAIWREALH